MISDFQAKIVGEGAAACKVLSEFSDFRVDRKKELHFEVKTEQDDLGAEIYFHTKFLGVEFVPRRLPFLAIAVQNLYPQGTPWGFKVALHL